MYLEKLEIHGFKSFANKNALVFGAGAGARPGLSVIVGPNGSGKSNVADAIRWALGEQSLKTLRGKKSEDVIFSGSDRKARLGLAEVSLYLNNADRQTALDYDQVVVTRRLFRNGDSEYLLNGSRVRLLDIQLLLAKANFGQKTYSVIGQGLVENFLNTSLSERKEFFDEATGVKQYQIKREDALNKLKLSLDNLQQSQMLIGEIEPHLKVLTRQVSRFARKAEWEEELGRLSVDYYGRLWRDLDVKLNKVNALFLEADGQRRDKEKKIVAVGRELAVLEQRSLGAVFAEAQAALAAAQAERDRAIGALAKIDARLEMKLENAGQFDLSFLTGRRAAARSRLAVIEAELTAVNEQVKSGEREADDLSAKRQALTEELASLNQCWQQRREVKTPHEAQARRRWENWLDKLGQAEAHHDLAEIKRLIKEIKDEVAAWLEEGVDQTSADTAAWQEKLLSVSQRKEKVLDDLNFLSGQLTGQRERRKFLEKERVELTKELAEIENRLSAPAAGRDDGGAERKKLAQDLEAAEEKIAGIRQEVAESQSEAEAGRRQIFNLQKTARDWQGEVAALERQMNDYKIEAARHETRLEDLETEIRGYLGDLSAVKAWRETKTADPAALERIHQLRRSLDSLGTIDPEVAREYQTTKERYDFLTAQVADLTGAVDSLKEVIAELDKVIKERFDQEFKTIADKFGEYFKILFSGGAAKIIKVMAEPESAAEAGESEATYKDKLLKQFRALSHHDAIGLAGIDIVATPPGKKIQSVAMLSGGERALTAIALICAIISANPAPFVVLDEVDAALDEANSGRLAKILDDLSDKTQFIAITHNRSLMRRAGILYGITMGEDGVSKLLSVKLEDAADNV